jgi:predicted GIY-YIG superfamily endonuclease
MQYPTWFWSISAVITACLRLGMATAIAAAVGSSASAGQAIAMDQTPPADETSIISDQELPLDAFGYLGGLFEARFYEPHSTTENPSDEIREAASLYGLDLAMMMSIAKVESDFDPRVRTGSYKGLFQLSDYEFNKYGDGSIWDARDNARAAAHMFLVQAEKFRWALGHYPDYAERYMVHQQGIQGAIEHNTHPERVAWESMCVTDEGALKGEQWCKRCIWGNLLPQWKDAFGSVDKISSKDFVSLWTDRINHLANRYTVAEGLASVSASSKNRVHHRIAVSHSKLRPPALHVRRIRVALAGLHRQ